MELTKITDIGEGLFILMKELGYSDASINSYKRIYSDFLNSLSPNEINEDLMEQCISVYTEDYISRHDTQSSNGKKRLREVMRFFNMMRDYHLYGVILHHRLRDKTPPKEYNDVINVFCDRLITGGLSKGTSERDRFVLERLSDFLIQRKCKNFAEMTMEDLLAFSSVQMGYSKKSAAASMYALRVFVDFLADTGINSDLSKQALPKVHYVSRRHLPKIWSDDECRRVLEAVDRNSPTGKRDFAILMLVINHGLRTSDVLNLTFSDIDWHAGEIHFVQKKTGGAGTVILDDATGWAIIDYLKNGRPNIKQYPNIFLQAKAPYIPMNSFNVCLQKYVERAGISYNKDQMHGLHSLRHSLATRMLESGTSTETISEVLGHININSTVDYLQISIDQLRKCALETEVE